MIARNVTRHPVRASFTMLVPIFLDVRSREELQAMLTAADAAITLAEAEIQRIEAALEFLRKELECAEALARTNAIPARALEMPRLDVKSNESRRRTRRHSLMCDAAAIAARLIDPARRAVRVAAFSCAP
jgi:HlyD family secretion protein